MATTRGNASDEKWMELDPFGNAADVFNSNLHALKSTAGMRLKRSTRKALERFNSSLTILTMR